jgi:hypothetical protein
VSESFPTLGHAAGQLFPTLWRGLRCIGRGLKKVGRALLYIILVLLAIHLVATLITGHMVRRKLADIKASGGALTIRELAPAVPPGQPNAADIYQKAFDAIRISADDQDILFDFDAPPTEERTHLARQVIAANDSYYELVEQASQIPACAFPVDWDAGFEMTFPHFADMRQAARMLRVRTEVQARSGDLDAAVASCAAALRIAEHAKMEPTLIGQLVAYAIQGFASDGLEHALSQGIPSVEVSRELHQQLAAIDQKGPFMRAMQGERAGGIWFFDFVRRGIPRDRLEDLFGPSEPWFLWQVLVWRLYRTLGRPLLNLDEVTCLDLWDRYVPAFNKPWPESDRQTNRMDAAIHAIPIYRGLLTRMIFPVFGRANWSRDRKTAILGNVQIALALKAFKAKNGRYPESLADLAGEGWKLPTDPFSGGPHHYRREGAGFVVWSTGQDMDDDNGRPLDEEALRHREFESDEEYRRAREDYDLPFRCAL